MCLNLKKIITYLCIYIYDVLLINQIMYKYLGFCLIINVSRSFPDKGFLKTMLVKKDLFRPI